MKISWYPFFKRNSYISIKYLLNVKFDTIVFKLRKIIFQEILWFKLLFNWNHSIVLSMQVILQNLQRDFLSNVINVYYYIFYIIFFSSIGKVLIDNSLVIDNSDITYRIKNYNL